MSLFFNSFVQLSDKSPSHHLGSFESLTRHKLFFLFKHIISIDLPWAKLIKFEPIKPVALENESITLEVPSKFYYEWIDSHYGNVLLEKFISIIVSDLNGITASIIYRDDVDSKSSIQTDRWKKWELDKPTKKPSNSNKSNKRTRTSQKFFRSSDELHIIFNGPLVIFNN